jgi:lantibiotic modifying enzyme
MSGTSAILAVHYYRLGDNVRASFFVDHVIQMSSIALDDDSDEILYGRAGYLLSLLFLARRLPATMLQPSFEETLLEVLGEMIESGRELGGDNCPLFYKWHDKSYLGSAHGLTGILQVLLMCGTRCGPFNSEIQKSIDRVVSLIADYDGKLPSSLESKNFKYCQWCHGAPGGVFLLCEAANHFEDKKVRYLAVSKQAAEDVWRRGILQKGPGLCHGVSGNAFVFLTLYRQTKEVKYLNRVYRFLEAYATQSIQSKMRTPDAYAVFRPIYPAHFSHFVFRPFSLYEGMGGIVTLASNLLYPDQSGFPAFELL